MKKLMTMVAAAAMAFGLYAGLSDNDNNTDFKALAVGPFSQYIDKNDSGNDSEPFYWSGEAGDSEIKAVSEAEGAAKFLAVDNSEVLYRTVNTKGADVEAEPETIGTGVFADMNVKFTAGDAEEEIVVADDAKLGLCVVADEEGNTNLIVKAAALASGDEEPVAANFTIAVGDEFDFDATHRVTIRAIDEISGEGNKMAGFILYIDEKLVAAAGDDYATKMGEYKFSSVAQPFAAEKQLFPSLVGSGKLLSQKIYGIGFKGSGELASVALTDADHAPSFAKPAVDVTIAWDAGVESYTYNIGAGDVTVPVSGADSAKITLPNAATLVTIDFTVGDAFVKGEIKATDMDLTEKGWQYKGSNAKLALNSAAVAYTIGDAKYATFEDALEAAIAAGEPTTITLAASINGWESEQVIESADADVTLDLAGYTLTFEDYTDVGILTANAGKLTVISSVAGGKMVVTNPSDQDFSIFYAEGGDIFIGAAEGDEGATFVGYIGETLGDGGIVNGSFDNVNNSQDALAALLADAENYEIVEAGDYWKVQEKQQKNFVIEIVDGKQYETIDEALADAQDGDTLKLLDDVALDAYVEIRKTITFDLGGKTLSSAKGVFDVYAKGVVIQNGAVNPTDGCGVWVNPNATAIIEKDVTITVPATAASNRAGVAAQGAATVNVLGKIVQNGPGSAIAGLGNAGDAASEILIGAEAVIESAGAGIYFPVTGGTLKILEGASITAAGTAVEVKAGQVVIGKATIATTTAIDAATHVKNNNGNSTTGYALAIVENKAYGDHIDVQVDAGAKFAGKVGIAIDDEDAPAPDEITILSGALFTDKAGAATLIAEDQQMAEEADEDGFYAVEAKKGGDIPTDPEKDITDDTKPADIGLDPAGPFKDAKKDELIKLSKWANKAGVKAAAINEGMQFGEGGAPVTEMADAYLLDCTLTELADAKKAFKFNADDLAAAMAGTVNPETFADRTYNGKIVIKAFSDVACETPAEDEAAAKFYKAFLVK